MIDADLTIRLALVRSTLDELLLCLQYLIGGAGVRREWSLWAYLRARGWARQAAAVAAVRFAATWKDLEETGRREPDPRELGLRLLEHALSDFRSVQRLERRLGLLAPGWTAPSLAAQVAERRVPARLGRLEELTGDIERGRAPLATELALEETVRLRVECRSICLELEDALEPDSLQEVQAALAPMTAAVRSRDEELLGLAGRAPIRDYVADLERGFFDLPASLGQALGEEEAKRLKDFGVRAPYLSLETLPWRAGASGQRWWL